MNNSAEINIERVDDIPVLLAQLERMGVRQLLDKHFDTHGNWQGMSLGWVSVVWLSYILSKADHCLSHVQPWVEKRLETLSICTGLSMRALDYSDDRLQAVLRYLSQDLVWQNFEQELGGQLLQVYDLKAERVRLDSTTASSYCGVNEQGLFQFGYSKDHRPDLAQIKIMLSTLDPLGMPVATEVLAGNNADDPLYRPAITKVKETLKQSELLYVGDCKMAALETRGFIQNNGDWYLMPLSATQIPESVLVRYLEDQKESGKELIEVYKTDESGQQKKIAEGFEIRVSQTTKLEGREITWNERQLVIRSINVATAAQKSLKERLLQAQLQVTELTQPRQGKKRLTSLSDYQLEAARIVEKYQVDGLLKIEYDVIKKSRQKRGYRGQPSQIIKEELVTLKVTVDESALEKKLSQLGWRVYGTNSPEKKLDLTQGVMAYRDEYLIEGGFARLKGTPLSLTPMYLQREDHIVGLIRLLSIGLRLLTLLEFDMRRSLSESNEKISGIYPGNKTRKTARPSSEILLRAFQEITLISVEVSGSIIRQITPLSPVQHKILAGLRLDPGIYTQLSARTDPLPSTYSIHSVLSSHSRDPCDK